MVKEQLADRLQRMAVEHNPVTIRVKELAEELASEPAEVRAALRQLAQDGAVHTRRRGPLGVDVFVGPLPPEEETVYRRKGNGEEAFCVYCGHRVRTGWNYCMHCGERIITGL